MICTECGRDFVPDERDDFADETEVCPECEAEWVYQERMRKHDPLLWQDDPADEGEDWDGYAEEM